MNVDVIKSRLEQISRELEAADLDVNNKQYEAEALIAGLNVIREEFGKLVEARTSLTIEYNRQARLVSDALSAQLGIPVAVVYKSFPTNPDLDSYVQPVWEASDSWQSSSAAC